jgi:hypothetical protein
MVMAHFCVRFTEFSRHVPWRRPHDTRFGVAARAANAISGSIGDGYIMTEELPLHEPAATRTRGAFLRDVFDLQWKLILGNLHNFILIPMTLGAAVLDLVLRSGPHGSRFYRVLAWGRHAEEAIDLYGALDRGRDHSKDTHVETVVIQEPVGNSLNAQIMPERESDTDRHKGAGENLA